MVKNKSLVFSLLNVNTLNDNKLVEYDSLTKHHHIQFITELNCPNKESENILKDSNDYNWQIINTDYSKNKARIAVRYPANPENKITVKLLDEGRINRPERIQFNKDVIQYLIMDITCFHVKYKVILVYRTPDTDYQDKERKNTKSLFEIIDKEQPHVCLGDFNLDQNDPRIKSEVSQMCSMKQIVGSNTRIAPSKNNKISKTLIDLVFVKWEISCKFKVKVLDTPISDHKMLIITIDISMPPVKLEMPIPIDKFRRYFPREGINWSKVRFKFNQNSQSPNETDKYYENLVKAITESCDQCGIVKRTQPFKKKTFRFSMSVKTRNWKSKRNIARSIYYRLKSLQASGSDITDQQIEESFQKFKKLRNKFNLEARKDRKRSLTKQFKKFTNNSKRLWSVVNRAKGKVKGMVENLSDPIFNSENMAKFFQDRSKIAMDNPNDFPNIPNTFTEIYNVLPNYRLENFNIELNQQILAKIMQYKPDPTPDPDGLSALIWNQFYFNVPAAKIAIDRLFYNVIGKSFKIPGLEHHDIKLHLKVEKPERQKDLRPVASLNSIPKRMLKLIFQQLKEHDKGVFYAENDYSGPKMGSDLAVIQTYENMQRGYFGINGKKNKKTVTSLRLFDKSNAFNTFNRKELIGNLSIGGDVRKIITNAVTSQSSFSVRSKLERSEKYELRTGGPQGQCGTGELFASITKSLTPPVSFQNLQTSQLVSVKRIEYVDDTSDTTTAGILDIGAVHEQTERKLVEDCKKYGLKLNSEKTKTLIVGDGLVSEKFLGFTINNRMNGESEMPLFFKRLQTIINSTMASTFLSRYDKMEIARQQIHSVWWSVIFLYIYLKKPKFEMVRKKINRCFKKATHLLMVTPTELVENYIYGMDFHSYVQLRFEKVVQRFKNMNSNIFDGTKIGRNGLMLRDPKIVVGDFIEKFILNYNNQVKFGFLNKKYSKNTVRNNKQSAFIKIVEFQNVKKQC